jgi:long-chain acyl-CoA synthetase
VEASFWDGKRAPGIPDTIDLSRYGSVVEAIENSFTRFADRPAFTSIGHTLRYGQIDEYSAAFAHYIQNHTSLKPGDSIAIQMPNVLQYPIALYGSLRAGLRIVNTNPLYTEREMLHQFTDSGAKAVLCMDAFANSVQNVLDQTQIELVIVTSLADMLPAFKRVMINNAAKHIKKAVPDYSLPDAVSFRSALKLGKSKEFEANHMQDPNDTVVLQYTGGTTGIAKAAELTNRNLVANMLQAAAQLGQVQADGSPVTGDEQAIIVAPLPLYHIYSFTVHLMSLFELGDHSVLIANPRDTDMFVRMMEPWKLNGIVGLNTLFVSLLANSRFTEMDFSEMTLTLSGGTALVEDTAVRWKEVTGIGISEAYGLTECSPAVSMNPVDNLERMGTVGQAMPGTALKCIDDEGNEVPMGERGELCVKGPQVMKGYWNRPEATQETFTEDGEWLRTGDVAIIDDDGFIRIVDRIKDLILVSGFNVYPNEIEDVVAGHPAVRNCAVIGVPDEKTGETPKLFVVVAEEQSLTEDEIKAWCKERLAAYKCPRQIEFRDKLPMSTVGKILRRELRDEEAAKQVAVES